MVTKRPIAGTASSTTFVRLELLVNVRSLEVLSPGDKITLMLAVDHVILGWVDVLAAKVATGLIEAEGEVAVTANVVGLGDGSARRS
jgi:hypothetical protein